MSANPTGSVTQSLSTISIDGTNYTISGSSALTNKGDWVSGTTYSQGDYVFSRQNNDDINSCMWITQTVTVLYQQQSLILILINGINLTQRMRRCIYI